MVLERLGVTLNTMTLGGLAIAIGVVVDDAVIDVENIVRRLRDNARSAQPRPFARVVLDATLEVRSAVVYATFAVILVVVPIMTLSGLTGRLFAPLGLAYTLAVLASLAVALTVTPALAVALLPGRVPPRDPPVVRWARVSYEALLRRLAQRPRTLIAAATLFTIAGCAALPFFPRRIHPRAEGRAFRRPYVRRARHVARSIAAHRRPHCGRVAPIARSALGRAAGRSSRAVIRGHLGSPLQRVRSRFEAGTVGRRGRGDASRAPSRLRRLSSA